MRKVEVEDPYEWVRLSSDASHALLEKTTSMRHPILGRDGLIFHGAIPELQELSTLLVEANHHLLVTDHLYPQQFDLRRPSGIIVKEMDSKLEIACTLMSSPTQAEIPIIIFGRPLKQRRSPEWYYESARDMTVALTNQELRRQYLPEIPPVPLARKFI